MSQQSKRSPSPQHIHLEAYSTADTNSIGSIEDANVKSTQPPGKCTKNATGSSSHVQFDGIVVPKDMRRSVRTTKASSKKDMGKLFAWLGQEFGVIAKTCTAQIIFYGLSG
jgi:hypothetical protein